MKKQEKMEKAQQALTLMHFSPFGVPLEMVKGVEKEIIQLVQSRRGNTRFYGLYQIGDKAKILMMGFQDRESGEKKCLYCGYDLN